MNAASAPQSPALQFFSLDSQSLSSSKVMKPGIGTYYNFKEPFDKDSKGYTDLPKEPRGLPRESR